MARRLLLPALLLLLALGAAAAFGFLAGQRSGTASAPEAAPAPAADLIGALRVIDGDTFDVGATRVRLHGVDAPEGAQTCLDAFGAPWRCGTWATTEARARWEGQEASCEVIETDRYNRAVSRCAVGGQDLGAALVGGGMALAYVAYSDDYLPEEREAEKARAGLWAGRFDAPWDWRRGEREAEPEGQACGIKGNISASGRIYHLPGSPSYARTRVEEGEGERWFCSAAEAEAAGWRAART